MKTLPELVRLVANGVIRGPEPADGGRARSDFTPGCELCERYEQHIHVGDEAVFPF